MYKWTLFKALSLAILAGLLISCASRTKPAPIENATQLPAYLLTPSAPRAATVAPTIQHKPSMAANPPPAKLGSLSREDSIQVNNKPVTQAPTINSAVKIKHGAENSNATWIMPASGHITTKFTPISKGIDISGSDGEPIYAINNGKVVYSGDGLKGYGNLIIIKHDETYLSAYAHNKVNLVKEGMTVKRGQKIAEMGTNNAQPLLHLELRRNGKPINPLSMIN